MYCISFTFISNNCKPQPGCSFMNLIAKQAPSAVMGFLDIWKNPTFVRVECVSYYYLMSNISAMPWWKQVTFRWDVDDACFILGKHE